MGFTENIQNNLSALSSLIGENNVDDIKKRIADIIVLAVEDDIKHYKQHNYVFYPPNYIEGIAEEAFEEVEKKIKKMYKDAMLDVAEKSVEKYKELVTSELKEEQEKM